MISWCNVQKYLIDMKHCSSKPRTAYIVQMKVLTRREVIQALLSLYDETSLPVDIMISALGHFLKYSAALALRQPTFRYWMLMVGTTLKFATRNTTTSYFIALNVEQFALNKKGLFFPRINFCCNVESYVKVIDKRDKQAIQVAVSLIALNNNQTCFIEIN